MLRTKKADSPLWETVIFIILNLIFFAAILAFVLRSSSGDAIIEENYAKTIALAIDAMKPNSQIDLDLQLLQERAARNRYEGNIVNFDFVNNAVNVKVRNGPGYTFHYFTPIKQSVTIIPIGEKSMLRITT